MGHFIKARDTVSIKTDPVNKFYVISVFGDWAWLSRFCGHGPNQHRPISVRLTDLSRAA